MEVGVKLDGGGVQVDPKSLMRECKMILNKIDGSLLSELYYLRFFKYPLIKPQETGN